MQISGQLHIVALAAAAPFARHPCPKIRTGTCGGSILDHEMGFPKILAGRSRPTIPYEPHLDFETTHHLPRRDLRKHEMEQHLLGYAVEGSSSSLHPIEPEPTLRRHLEQYKSDGGHLSKKDRWNKYKLFKATSQGKEVVANRMHVKDVDGREAVLHHAYLKSSPKTSLTFGRTTRDPSHATSRTDSYYPIAYKYSHQQPEPTPRQIRENAAARQIAGQAIARLTRSGGF